MAQPRGLRLVAHDEEDLRALSAAVQDAVARVGELRHDPRRRTFTAVLNRYRWEAGGRSERVRAALRADGVVSVRGRGLATDRPNAVANLLALMFTPGAEPPAGVLRLVFSGGGEIELAVECLDVSVIDVSRPWSARGRPRHETAEGKG